MEKQRSLAEAAKRGEQVSAVTALSACDTEAPKTSDGTGHRFPFRCTLVAEKSCMKSGTRRRSAGLLVALR